LIKPPTIDEQIAAVMRAVKYSKDRRPALIAALATLRRVRAGMVGPSRNEDDD
jgi:hypothetical protein